MSGLWGPPSASKRAALLSHGQPVVVAGTYAENREAGSPQEGSASGEIITVSPGHFVQEENEKEYRVMPKGRQPQVAQSHTMKTAFGCSCV